MAQITSAYALHLMTAAFAQGYKVSTKRVCRPSCPSQARILDRVAAAANGEGKKPQSSDRAPDFSEESIALAFAEKHSAHLQYVDTWGSWLVWDGLVWRKDETRLALDLARPLCREQARKADTQKLARQLAGASTASAVVRLACTDRRIAATAGEWDRDIWALNTPDGVVDLKTGKLYPHHPDLRMTKITKVGPGGDCPTWIRFLNQVTGGEL